MKNWVFKVWILAAIFSGSAFAEEAPFHYTVTPRSDQIGTFPCLSCHKSLKEGFVFGDLKKKHTEMVFEHMPDVRKCSFCHNAKDPNKLNLLDGTLVSYDESFKICRQCHGKEGINWASGIHGNLAGYWTGERSHFSCAACHNPHTPVFKPMNTFIEPPRPKFLIDKTEGEH